jgi:hypothetical protein
MRTNEKISIYIDFKLITTANLDPYAITNKNDLTLGHPGGLTSVGSYSSL